MRRFFVLNATINTLQNSFRVSTWVQKEHTWKYFKENSSKYIVKMVAVWSKSRTKTNHNTLVLNYVLYGNILLKTTIHFRYATKYTFGGHFIAIKFIYWCLPASIFSKKVLLFFFTYKFNK